MTTNYVKEESMSADPQDSSRAPNHMTNSMNDVMMRDPLKPASPHMLREMALMFETLHFHGWAGELRLTADFVERQAEDSPPTTVIPITWGVLDSKGRVSCITQLRRAMTLVEALVDWRKYWETDLSDDLILTGKQADELCVFLNVPFDGVVRELRASSGSTGHSNDHSTEKNDAK